MLVPKVLFFSVGGVDMATVVKGAVLQQQLVHAVENNQIQVSF
jgi:hypothetical protein